MNDTDFWGDETRRDERDNRAQRTQQRKKQTKKKKGGGAAVMVALLFLLAVVGGGGYFGYTKLKNAMDVPDYSGEGTGAVTVEVKEGDYISMIGNTLQKQDVVKSAKAFNKAAEDEPKAQSIQPGFYNLRQKMSAQAALTLLLDPKSRQGVIDIPPGRRDYEVFALLSKATKIPLAQFKKVNPKSLNLPPYAGGKMEGYLFPDRYDIPPKATAAQLLKMMVDRFKAKVGVLDLGSKPGQVITMASLIEAEAGKPADYPKISRVIYNRVKIGMPLKFDTTVLYFLKKRTYQVYDKETQIKHPYNTYQNKGLPPGPIGSPGVAAIEAVLKPAPGTWLYFVATDPTNKVTEFATSEADFNKLVAKFRAWQKKNPGN